MSRVPRWSINLQRFAENVTWCNTQLAKQATDKAKDRIKAQLLETFDSQSDPYGRRWAPRRHPRPWPTLNRSGRLRGSLDVSVQDNVLRIRIGAPYATFHQQGTRYLDRRMIVPVGITPESIASILKQVIDEEVTRRFT